MNFIAFNHQGKGGAYISALKEYGYTEYSYKSGRYDEIDFSLTDHDGISRLRRLETLRNAGCKTHFLYPHTARPNLINDIYEPWLHTTAQFVATDGHIEIIRRYGYKKPLHSVGWALCPLKPFRPKLKVRNVLFAPIHPRSTDRDKAVNNAAWNRLYKLAQDGAIKLIVRFIGDCEECGLKMIDHPNVEYVPGGLDLSYKDIDKADLVVSHQTFAWLAVARGVPTLMMGEDMPTHTNAKNGESVYVGHWDDYKDLLMFPLDILTIDDTMALIERATRSDDDIREWRTRLIGVPFDANKFIKFVENYI